MYALRQFIAAMVCLLLALTRPLHAQEAKPNVLIIGDSISMGYGPIVSGLLANAANVSRPLNENGGQLNCEGTTRGVERIDDWLAVAKWDVIHFNFGLHDIKHVHPETGRNSSNPEHPQQANLTEYEANLKQIVTKLQASGATLIFATTTPYPDNPGGPLRRADQVAKYNQVAQRVMQENEIRVNDLHGFVLPQMDRLLLPNNVHFKAVGSKALAGRVAKAIRDVLPDASSRSDRSLAWEHLALQSKNANVTDDHRLAQQINRLGKEGWQLVDVSTIERQGTTQRLVFYFKRPRSR